ncbi:703_t:CDS:2 [Paraglomus occultum]|uniref:703_t:CDS:1 n=1 Tax=Paraglomus occultum TaxID=144539 RepID=A0A9N9A651_9GLOM|nr:703_t:CDS:2 [Paraglomus occultum]
MAAAQPKTPQTPLLFGLSMTDMNNTLTVNAPKQAASSLPNSPSVLGQMYPKHNENGFLNIPSIITSREGGNMSVNSLSHNTMHNSGMASSVTESFTLLGNEAGKNQIHQAISAPVTPTSSGFGQPPRRGGNSNLAHIPCKFYKSGACTAGKNCVFSHDKNPSPDNYVCKYYIKGNCKFGSKCALSHANPTDRKNPRSNKQQAQNISRLNGNNNNNNSNNSNNNNNNSNNGHNNTNNTNGNSNNTNGITVGINTMMANSNIPEIRSPSMPPNGYSDNDFPPMNSPSSFSRIPIVNGEFSAIRSQLTASLSSYPEDMNVRTPVSPQFGDHLTAPMQIHAHRRSLPDIFRYPQEAYGTSPYQLSKPHYIPVSMTPENNLLSPTMNGPLQSIPENCAQHDDVVDDNTLFEYDFLPSSLNDLLTPLERERRRSRQEETFETSRRIFPPNLQPVPVDTHKIMYNNNIDPSHIHIVGRSLPHGVSIGLAANYLPNNADSTHLSPTAQYDFNPTIRSPTSPSPTMNPFSPSDTWHLPNPFTLPDPRSHSYSTPAINIPSHDVYSPTSPIFHDPVKNQKNGGNGLGRMRTPDPFTTATPFSPDDDVQFQFYMEEDKGELGEAVHSGEGAFEGKDGANNVEHGSVNTNGTATATGSETTEQDESSKQRLSYSDITKTGIKDSGAAGGISIDSRRYEPLCPFAMAGICRYGDRCRNLHGLSCPKCRKLVLHPRGSVEEHQAHISSCNPIPQEDIECGICYERVLSKPDARFGLLNCDHAFCLSCIRQWRSNNTMNNQVIRSCPVCRVNTYFVTPSMCWISEREEKKRVVEEYKRKCSTIPCKHFNYGNGQCPFGTSCFYAHTYPDGRKEETRIRTVCNGEEVKVINKVRLWDFVENWAQGQYYERHGTEQDRPGEDDVEWTGNEGEDGEDETDGLNADEDNEANEVESDGRANVNSSSSGGRPLNPYLPEFVPLNREGGP